MRRLLAPLLMAPLLGAAGLETFASTDWGVRVRYPADLVAATTFKTIYFDRGAWRVSYAADTGPGTRLLGLSLPDLKAGNAGGDSAATAELRVGASRDPDVVGTCLSYGTNSGNNAEVRQRTIGGVAFTEVPDNSDGETSRQIQTDDFRAVHHGACYAIDLVLFVEGIGDKLPAFAPTQVDRLRDVLNSIHFD